MHAPAEQIKIRQAQYIHDGYMHADVKVGYI